MHGQRKSNRENCHRIICPIHQESSLCPLDAHLQCAVFIVFFFWFVSCALLFCDVGRRIIMHRFCTVSRAQSTSGTSSSGSSVLNIAKLFGANRNNPCRLPRFVVCGITIIQVHFMCFRQQMFCSRRHYFHVQQSFISNSSNLGIKTFKYYPGGKMSVSYPSSW